MKGDFTRNTFDPKKHFSRVLMQQGRVTLDADHNEQTAILLHYMRTLASDLLGPYAVPAGEEEAFKLTSVPASGVVNDIKIGNGHCYVDGILVENDEEKCTYLYQPDYTPPNNDKLRAALSNPADTSEFLLYLDVWERHITSLEDNGIREQALGGPDTCTRAQVVWQVKAWPKTKTLAGSTSVDALVKLQDTKKKLGQQLKKASAQKLDKLKEEIDAIDAQLAEYGESPSPVGDPDKCKELLDLLNSAEANKPRLAARVDPGHKIEDACVTAPDSKYRGAENQLYRVEIHQGGTAGTATFKWSRDNGSIATRWLGTSGHDIQVASSRGFAAGNWVELSDDTRELRGEPGVLVKLVKVEGGMLSVDPTTTTGIPAWSEQLRNPKVRRWDQVQTEDIVLNDEGAVPVKESVWIDLEDRIQIQFAAGTNNQAIEYRAGDYWLIPARVATGTIEWPVHELADGTVEPVAMSPHGTEHHYAPLCTISWPGGVITEATDCQCVVQPYCRTP
jgi:hypothetical protein